MLTIIPDPQLTYDDVFAEWKDPVITVNGVDYDLSLIPDGATVKHPILSTVDRDGDDYTIHIILPHIHDAPDERKFPAPIIMEADGEVVFPPNTWPDDEEPDPLENEENTPFEKEVPESPPYEPIEDEFTEFVPPNPDEELP